MKIHTSVPNYETPREQNMEITYKNGVATIRLVKHV